jgi:hypothetical protein
LPVKGSGKLRKSVLVLFCAGIFLFVQCQKKTGSLHDGPLPPTPGTDTTETNPPDAVYRNLIYSIAPGITDPLISKASDNHIVCVSTDPAKKNLLYVFLPGTHRNPKGCQATVIKAATLGFHAIGLMYDNSVPVNPLCKDGTDITCHSRARREVIDGVDRHPAVNTNKTESIINRLVKLLKYLSLRYPDQGWQQYVSGQDPDWSKIIIAGHSQGGCLAGVIGKYYPVKKVIMLSAIDFMLNKSVPDWEQIQTNREKYFGLINVKDEQVPFDFEKLGWKSLAMMNYGTMADAIRNSYSHTHTLISTENPPDSGVDKYHNSTGVDSYIPKDASGKYIYDAAWEYMMLEGN